VTLDWNQMNRCLSYRPMRASGMSLGECKRQPQSSLTLIASCALAISCFGQPQRNPSTSSSDGCRTVASCEFVDEAGSIVKLRQFKGHPILVTFWATWCTACRVEVPEIDRIYRSGAKAGLIVVGVNEDVDQTVAKRYRDALQLSWAGYRETQPDKRRGLKRPIPFTVLFDKHGFVVYRHSGDDDDSSLIEALAKCDPSLTKIFNSRSASP